MEITSTSAPSWPLRGHIINLPSPLLCHWICYVGCSSITHPQPVRLVAPGSRNSSSRPLPCPASSPHPGAGTQTQTPRQCQGERLAPPIPDVSVSCSSLCFRFPGQHSKGRSRRSRSSLERRLPNTWFGRPARTPSTPLCWPPCDCTAPGQHSKGRSKCGRSAPECRVNKSAVCVRVNPRSAV